MFSARREFRKALEIYPEAETLAREIVEKEPDAIEYQYLLGVCLEKLGDVHHDLGENNLALKYFNNHFQMQQELCDPPIN